MSKRYLNFLLPAATGALFIAIWYAVRFSMAEEMRFLLPTPGEIIDAFQSNSEALARAALNTAEGALLGFVAAILVSCLLALVLSLSSLVRVSLYPYLMMLQMIPV
ncbi:MAG: ABC transporter permease, partial [Opitutaceae bacterium]